MKNTLHKNCKTLLNAFKSGKLGQTVMPEDSNPGFSDKDTEIRIAYFTLPMALNYQRDSYRLWEAVLIQSTCIRHFGFGVEMGFCLIYRVTMSLAESNF